MNEVQLAAVLTAAVAGVASLPHCFVMCGPLAAAGCGAGPTALRRGATYVVGRLVGYAAVGALLGQYGGQLLHRVANAHVNVVAASLVVAVCLYHAASRLREAWRQRAAPANDDKLVSLTLAKSVAPGAAANDSGRWFGSDFAKFITALLPRTPLGLGLVTAILPCSALFGAWVLAAASAHPTVGALSMFAFAVASSPALLLAVFGRTAVSRLGVRMPAVVAAAGWLAVALLLVGRLWLTQGGAPCH